MPPREPSSSCERLESAENLGFQRRSWRWETAGRALVFLLVVAAVAGVFGGGPLSRGEAVSADGLLRVEYPRFARSDAGYQIKVHVANGGQSEGSVELTVDAALLEALEIESAAPDPEAVLLDAGRMLFRFRVANNERLAPILLHVKTGAIGSHDGAIALRGGAEAKLKLWVHP